ncbi:MAG: type II toxin-antitoxin system VapC family toxin [Myxococcaceae bacterium]
MIVLDTHALLWWALSAEQLSAAAAEVCERMERDGGFASSISIWELGVKIRNGKLDLGLPLPEFVRRLEQGGVVELLPVDTSIWIQTATLEWDHRDPADRVIVATALQKGLPILTKDDALHGFGAVQCVW